MYDTCHVCCVRHDAMKLCSVPCCSIHSVPCGLVYSILLFSILFFSCNLVRSTLCHSMLFILFLGGHGEQARTECRSSDSSRSVGSISPIGGAGFRAFVGKLLRPSCCSCREALLRQRLAAAGQAEAVREVGEQSGSPVDSEVVTPPAGTNVPALEVPLCVVSMSFLVQLTSQLAPGIHQKYFWRCK